MRRLLALTAMIVLFLTFAGWESAGAQNGPAVCPPPTELVRTQRCPNRERDVVA